MLDSPLVFFIFNRPDPTRLVWEQIRQAQPRRLFLVADGPRPARAGEKERCAEVRRIVESVDWPCTVERNYSAANLGCGKRIASGLDWVFSQVETAIILEDDCLPDPSFFPFCEELLNRYRDEPRVAQIAGCSYQGGYQAHPSTSYYFSRYPHCWGWATWRRAWSHYDRAMKSWPEWRDGNGLARWIENSAERRLWVRNFNDTANGLIDTWDYQWTMTVWRQQWVSILPYRNLISNIGFGPDATHTNDFSAVAALPLSSMPFPLQHPSIITCDQEADERTSHLVFRPPSLFERCKRRLRKIFRQ